MHRHSYSAAHRPHTAGVSPSRYTTSIYTTPSKKLERVEFPTHYGSLTASKPCKHKRKKRKKTKVRHEQSYRQQSYETLLPTQELKDRGKKTLVLDLDETLIHSSKDHCLMPGIEVREIDKASRQGSLQIAFRPGVWEFLRAMESLYEIVIFTASVKSYADQIIDMLDTRGKGYHRLYRNHCQRSANFIKNLGMLGRDLKKVLIVDNTPQVYALNRENAIPIQSWFDDPSD
jgi:RNA polymerase II subunit A small phosphatase-like protein